MGVAIVNLEIIRDHATRERDSAVRLHMDLPVDYKDVPEIEGMLESGRRADVRKLLSARYPQYAELLMTWLRMCADRVNLNGQDSAKTLRAA